MSIIFRFVEKLPLVRILQVTAIFLLISSLVTVFQMLFQMSRSSVGDVTREFIISLIPMSLLFLGQAFYQPLVLLALAEIIKRQAQQTNLHD